MKTRQLTLLIASAFLLSLSAGCELIVDFDRDTIDSSIGTVDACGPSCADSGTDASDEDSGTMDAMVPPGDSGMDAEVMADSGMDAEVTVDSGMDAADDEDSGL